MMRRLASAVWSRLSEGARRASDAGWLSKATLGPRVISVGNLQAGGAGKTPLVALIAREAHERGIRACILCRGYGGAWERRGGAILPGDALRDAGECGDEAALLHDLAPEAAIGVGADRVAAYGRVVELRRKRGGPPFDLVILDDGFQHWRIRKDLEIVAVTSAREGEAIFRDRPSALRRADLVVWTKGGLRPDCQGRPTARVRYRLPQPEGWQRPIWLVTGIADGRHAEAGAREAGYRIERHLSFPDHARYAERAVQDILEGAERAGCAVAVTGKDWVKWRTLGVERSRVQVLEPELVFEEGRELWLRTLWGQ